MTALLLVAAACGYLYWTTNKKPAAAVAIPRADNLFRVPPQVTKSPPEFPSLNERDAEDADPRPAIDRLLVVRRRLAATGRLDDANSKAVDQLMLELVHGKAEGK
jgi:hypothetical protein